MKLKTLTDFIESHEDWQKLLSADPYNLKIREQRNEGNYHQYLLSYDMIRSDMSLDICQVCRGIIIEVTEIKRLDRGTSYYEVERECRVVMRAFDKFFNYGENQAAKIDWNSRVFAYEKLDGSLIKCTTELGKLMWTTNNSFNADAELPGDLICEYNSFQDLINEATKKWDDDTLQCLEQIGQNWYLMFELVSPFNRIVVPYQDVELIWLGARKKSTQEELRPELLEYYYRDSPLVYESKVLQRNLKRPKIYELSSMSYEAVQNIVAKMDATQEGIVLMDEHFNRVKIKGDAYLAIHRMKDGTGGLSMKHLLKCIQNNTIDDIIANFPEYETQITDVVNLYKEVDQHLQWAAQSVYNFKSSIDPNRDEKEVKKQFAMMVKDNPYQKFYFTCYKFNNSDEWTRERELFLNSLDYETIQKLAVAPYL